MKNGIKALTALLFNAMVGLMFAFVLGVPAAFGAATAVGVSVLAGPFMPTGGALCEGVLTEVWTGELIKTLRAGDEATFLDGIPDYSQYADKDIIHMIDVGGDPDVLVNNTTYPIAIQEITDNDAVFSLDKFQTKVTPITDDELYAISYDKISRVKESHSNAINDSKFAKAAHALCANENTATTPVLTTSGERDAVTGRLKFTIKDVVKMKAALDKLGVPADNRRLVLCADHVNDLLETEQSFKEQYNINRGEGKVGRLYGFDIYEYTNTPYYTTAGKKKDLGATTSTGEFHCSFAFYTKRVFKATGTTKMYWSHAENDPEYQRNKVNFRHYFICMPKKADAGVVMASGYKAS